MVYRAYWFVSLAALAGCAGVRTVPTPALRVESPPEEHRVTQREVHPSPRPLDGRALRFRPTNDATPRAPTTCEALRRTAGSLSMAVITVRNVDRGETLELGLAGLEPEFRQGRQVYFLQIADVGGLRTNLHDGAMAIVFDSPLEVQNYTSGATGAWRSSVGMSLATGGDFIGGPPGTSWSSNEGGYAMLRVSRCEGDVCEGELAGRLVSNDRRTFILIERGMVCLRRVPPLRGGNGAML